MGFGPNQNWIGDERTALNAVIILNAWTTSGTFMLFYLASLQTISGELYEAAALDGAGWWQTFRRITFPLLRPAHYFVATVATIGALQLFDQAYIGGGPNGDPNNALMTVVLYLFNTAVLEGELRAGGGRRRDPVPDHLHGDARAAAAVRRDPHVAVTR